MAGRLKSRGVEPNANITSGKPPPNLEDEVVDDDGEFGEGFDMLAKCTLGSNYI